MTCCQRNYGSTFERRMGCAAATRTHLAPSSQHRLCVISAALSRHQVARSSTPSWVRVALAKPPYSKDSISSASSARPSIAPSPKRAVPMPPACHQNAMQPLWLQTRPSVVVRAKRQNKATQEAYLNRRLLHDQRKTKAQAKTDLRCNRGT
jgi:hypothetical protein